MSQLQDNLNEILRQKREILLPNNIRAGVTVLGVEGNMEADKPDQSKDVFPSTERQIITADTGYELGSVNVYPVTANIDSNIAPENIKKNTTILGVVGTFEGSGGGGDGEIKLFANTEEMNAATADEGTLAEIYSTSEIYPSVGTVNFSDIKLSKSVALSSDEYEQWQRGDLSISMYGQSENNYFSFYLSEWNSSDISVWNMSTQEGVEVKLNYEWHQISEEEYEYLVSVPDSEYEKLQTAISEMGEIDVSQIDGQDIINRFFKGTHLEVGLYERKNNAWVARNIGTTAVAGDILMGKSAFINNKVTSGTMDKITKTNALTKIYEFPNPLDGQTTYNKLQISNDEFYNYVENGALVNYDFAAKGEEASLGICSYTDTDSKLNHGDYLPKASYTTFNSGNTIAFDTRNKEYAGVHYQGSSSTKVYEFTPMYKDRTYDKVPANSGTVQIAFIDGILAFDTNLYTSTYIGRMMRLSDGKSVPFGFGISNDINRLNVWNGKVVYPKYNSDHYDIVIYDFDTDVYKSVALPSTAGACYRRILVTDRGILVMTLKDSTNYAFFISENNGNYTLTNITIGENMTRYAVVESRNVLKFTGDKLCVGAAILDLSNNTLNLVDLSNIGDSYTQYSYYTRGSSQLSFEILNKPGYFLTRVGVNTYGESYNWLILTSVDGGEIIWNKSEYSTAISNASVNGPLLYDSGRNIFYTYSISYWGGNANIICGLTSGWSVTQGHYGQIFKSSWDSSQNITVLGGYPMSAINADYMYDEYINTKSGDYEGTISPTEYTDAVDTSEEILGGTTGNLGEAGFED